MEEKKEKRKERMHAWILFLLEISLRKKRKMIDISL
jgi:hypothetical protein